MKTPKKLFGYTRENQYDNQYMKVPMNEEGTINSIERNPEWKSGMYIEHNMLQETDLLETFELDMEGRDEVGSLGIFKVKPEHFTVEIRETFDKTKTWYEYRLTEDGWKYLEENGLKHPGRGYVRYNLITNEDVELKRKKLRNQISSLDNELFKLYQL